MTYDAWILEKGNGSRSPGKLKPYKVEIGTPGPEEIMVAPLYGCMEANILHAIQRQPVDVCELRGEPFIVPGNACVAKVIEVGTNVSLVKKGDFCMGFGIEKADPYGYPVTVLGYDAAHSAGAMVKRAILNQNQMIPLPTNTQFSLLQWTAFSARYVSAWSNWKLALNCWRSQMAEADTSQHYVCGWGGGVSLAELQLAKQEGFKTIMISAKKSRLTEIADLGITPMDRSDFRDLNFNFRKYYLNPFFKKKYKKNEKKYLDQLRSLTDKKGVSIFIDNIGQSVQRATLKSMARQGVIASCGWKTGMEMFYLQALECINRHVHVHTHYASYKEAIEAMAHAEKTGWMPNLDGEKVYDWEEIPALCDAYALEKIDSYFPIFKINSLESLD